MTTPRKARLYFNHRGPLPWSIDTGLQTDEYQCKHVIFDGVAGCTVYRPTVGDNQETPTAWVEFEDVQMSIVSTKTDGDTVLILKAPRANRGC